ncbi:TPA: hypothetical protein NI671_002593 [Pseudomonas aeruginosa]|uniref:hypothetical protein n=1 Tax=Pseudomonas aeruginosa TaxID=287 RepID=UPI001DB56EC6|nr:hypothetical protein [Pseudomonas aeruginosa]MBX6698964.1 hypothetical protein [Pseudomonas aeruginosa]WMX07976.1 hypothetical protein RG643_30040 [Pseudomonas aeruginosa]HCF4366162.1 hypothetical protein [Pseudomonas aeruginosa]HCF4370133.1 hypothetical protein [Pseudomonas aeruginosa]HCF4411218.1 hypothetical protein [Pseudomonas aeruginosa]
MADLDPITMSFSHPKFGTMLHEVFLDAANTGVVQVYSDGMKVTARSVRFQES